MELSLLSDKTEAEVRNTQFHGCRARLPRLYGVRVDHANEVPSCEVRRED